MTNTIQETTIVDTYLAVWNETDAERRADLVAQAWSVDGVYADPMLEAAGHEAIADMAAGVQAQFPDHRFRRTTDIDTHRDYVRFGWELTAPDGNVVVAGIDVALMGEDGRIAHLVGFFGDLTPMP